MDVTIARTRLEDERRRLQGALDALENEHVESDELSARDQHVADAGTDTYERERAFGIGDDLRAALADVDAAFARLDAGDYGRCAVCHGAIGDERLDAVPATRYCVAHQDEWEHDSRGLTAAGRAGAAQLARRASARTAQEASLYTAVEFLPDDDELEEESEMAAEESAMHEEREPT